MLSTTFDGSYGFKSGTSMAAPHVVGCFALALAAGVTDPRAAIPLGTTPPMERGMNLGHGVIDAVKMATGGQEPVYNRLVTLDGRLSTDDGIITKYEWAFQQGEPLVDLGKSLVEHGYAADGVFQVTLRVTDDGTPPLQSTIMKDVTIQDPLPNRPPVAEFTAELTGARPFQIRATSSSSDPDGDTMVYEWDFNYGTSPGNFLTSVPVHTHTYAGPGTFEIAHRVTDSKGLVSDIVFQTIVVPVPNSPPLANFSVSNTPTSPPPPPPPPTDDAPLAVFTIQDAPA